MKNNNQQSPFEREIVRANKEFKKTQESLESMKQKMNNSDINGAYLDALNFADAAEKLTLTARQLPAYTGNPQALKKSEQIITDNVPVQMGFTPEGWFCVVIPALLPKKVKGSADYIRDIMYLSMGKFFRGKKPVRYTDCVMIFRHIYHRDRPERQYRDHDNIEVNMAADIVALYVLFDDSPLKCSHYYCSAPGNENRTEIFVVPQSEFGAWILDTKNNENKAVLLSESIP